MEHHWSRILKFLSEDPCNIILCLFIVYLVIISACLWLPGCLVALLLGYVTFPKNKHHPYLLIYMLQLQISKYLHAMIQISTCLLSAPLSPTAPPPPYHCQAVVQSTVQSTPNMVLQVHRTLYIVGESRHRLCPNCNI